MASRSPELASEPDVAFSTRFVEPADLTQERQDGAAPALFGDDLEKAHKALRAMLREIEALPAAFARGAVDAFRAAAVEGQLGFDGTAKVLEGLDLCSFVSGSEDLPLGAGEEWQRLWRLWKSEADTVDEQCFLWLAWRAHRFSEPGFVKEVALPLFRHLDLNSDSFVSLKELEAALAEGEVAANQDKSREQQKTDLLQLLLYHAPREAGKEPAVSLQSFLAWMCDAQDLAAMRKASAIRPVECLLRFDRGVIFLRPLDVHACVHEELQPPVQKIVEDAKTATQEARQAAEEARKAKEELFAQAAPKLEAPAPANSTPGPEAAPAARRLNEAMIEEATEEPVKMQTADHIEEAPVFSPAPREKSRETRRKVASPKRIHISVTDVKCPSCTASIKSDSNFCRHCGVSLQERSRNSVLMLKVDHKAKEAEQMATVHFKPRLPCAVDSDTQHLPDMVEAPTPTSRTQGVEVEEEVEETTCSTCQRDFLSGAYFCANCGQKRGYSKPVSTLQSRMPATSTPTIRRAQDNFSTQRSPFEAPEGACAPPEEEPEGLGRRVSEVDSNFTAVAVELHNAKYASMPTQAMHAAPPLPSPAPAWKVCTNSAKGAATVALDLSGNGMPDVYVKGADLDNDGIPDILQQTGEKPVLVAEKPEGQQLQIAQAAQPTGMEQAQEAPVLKAASAAPATAQSEEDEWYYEEGEEEEDFEDDPEVEIAPKEQTAKGQAKNQGKQPNGKR